MGAVRTQVVFDAAEPGTGGVLGRGPSLRARVVKNRVHLDLVVGPEAHDGEVERLVGLGATAAECS